ncbi:hypothetical protein LJB95_02040, partial [Paludibacteraceae bacterium OttesenSCG-928-F17]|nr:hypothetical protein [Paludibacteraceae bacterium OttesenSCG-928-F17]
QFFDQLSFHGLVGYTIPQGKLFKADDGKKLSGGGINVDLDILYHFDQLDYKLGVGVSYNGSFLFAADFEDMFSIGLYGLDIYGVKGYYRFFDSNISPYASLTVGVSQFSTPKLEVVVDGSESYEIIPSQSSFGLGLRPEIGVELGGFNISAAYVVPMNYKLFDEKRSAGGFQISIGYRYTLFDW